MNPARFALVEQLFREAAAVRGPQRAALLDSRCADDTDLRGEIEGLLRLDDTPVSFLDDDRLPAAAAGRLAEALGSSSPYPDRIGEFVITGVLGTGGMGVVYRARQQHPQRDIALKVLRIAAASRAILARFELEAETLARLQHPAIAQVFQSGTVDLAGFAQPYLAMELVEGAPITEYADANRLDIPARLALVQQVCAAVQHAHRRGVIHRDLKPGNILVTPSGQPKLLDFGIARVQDLDRTDAAVTRAGQLIGTPTYMSPEQLSGDPDAVDTRADVFALGVILYELLAGRPPRDLARVPIGEAVARVAEPAPSLASANRRLRGDLATIAAKALEPDRERRYASPADLAADLERYLRFEPIQARPAGLAYRARRFARRHRVPVAAASVALVASLVALALGVVESNRHRAEAQRQVEASRETVRLLTDVLRGGDTDDEPSRGLTVREAFDRVASEINGRYPEAPHAEAAVRLMLGMGYTRLGETQAAIGHLQRALELRRAMHGPAHPGVMEALLALGNAYTAGARPQEAVEALREAMDVGARDDPRQDRESMLEARTSYAAALDAAGRPGEALPILEAVVRDRRRHAGERDETTLASMHTLGVIYHRLGRTDDARRTLEATLEARRALFGPEHPRTLVTMSRLAPVYDALGRCDEALALYESALQLRRRHYGPDSPRVLTAMNDLALHHQRCGRPADAEPLFRRVLEIRRATIGPDHRQALISAGNLAGLYLAMDRPGEAAPLLDDAVARARRSLPSGDWFLGSLLSWQGSCQLALGHGEQAEVTLLEAFQIIADALGEHHERARRVSRRLADLYQGRGDAGRAATWLARAEGGASSDASASSAAP